MDRVSKTARDNELIKRRVEGDSKITVRKSIKLNSAKNSLNPLSVNAYNRASSNFFRKYLLQEFLVSLIFIVLIVSGSWKTK